MFNDIYNVNFVTFYNNNKIEIYGFAVPVSQWDSNTVKCIKYTIEHLDDHMPDRMKISTEVSHTPAGSCPTVLNISYDNILNTRDTKSDTMTSDVNY